MLALMLAASVSVVSASGQERTAAPTGPARPGGRTEPLRPPSDPPREFLVVPSAPEATPIPAAPRAALPPLPPPATATPGPVPASVAGRARVTVGFADRSDALDGAGTGLLDDVAARLAAEPSLRVELRAYAARQNGEDGPARRLSLARAKAVRDHLVGHGIAQQRLIVFAHGSDTAEGDPDRVDLAFR